MKNSIITSRDFCKFMITISTGAIPVYLGLLKFILPENFILPLKRKLLISVPPFIFLFSEILFIIGYLPQADYFSLDIIDEIQKSYDMTLKKRGLYTNIGIMIFIIGTILSILTVFLIMMF